MDAFIFIMTIEVYLNISRYVVMSILYFHEIGIYLYIYFFFIKYHYFLIAVQNGSNCLSILSLIFLVQQQTDEVNLIRQGLYDLQATQKNMKVQ